MVDTRSCTGDFRANSFVGTEGASTVVRSTPYDGVLIFANASPFHFRPHARLIAVIRALICGAHVHAFPTALHRDVSPLRSVLGLCAVALHQPYCVHHANRRAPTLLQLIAPTLSLDEHLDTLIFPCL